MISACAPYVPESTIPAPLITESYVFVGDVEEFLAGRPSDNPEIAAFSRASLRDLRAGVGSRQPLVFVIRRWNRGLRDAALVRDRLVPIDSDLFLLTGPGLVDPDPASVAAASRAAAEARAVVVGERDASNVPHLAQVLGIALLTFLPGALALGWFGRFDTVSLVATAPAMSLALNVTVGFLALSITREPVTEGMAWSILAVATLIGAGLMALGARTRPKHRTVEREPDELEEANVPVASR